VRVRVATYRDLDAVTATLTAAFEADPLWSWAFPERDGLAAWWRLMIRSALRYPWVWIAHDYAAASLWIPPAGIELTEEEEALVEPMLTDLVGPRASTILDQLGRFETPTRPSGRTTT
jgi:hypothetical protein